jgi:hypothetical protein
LTDGGVYPFLTNHVPTDELVEKFEQERLIFTQKHSSYALTSMFLRNSILTNPNKPHNESNPSHMTASAKDAHPCVLGKPEDISAEFVHHQGGTTQ